MRVPTVCAAASVSAGSLLFSAALAGCQSLPDDCTSTQTCPFPEGGTEGGVASSVGSDDATADEGATGSPESGPGDDAAGTADTSPNCSPEQTLCGSSCADTTSDPNHCGSCDTQCPAPASGSGAATCTSSQCGVTCNSGSFLCNGDCHSPAAPPTDSCVVNGPTQLAVFVSPKGDDASATGSATAPVKTLNKGLALAQSLGMTRLYVCNGTYADAMSAGAGAAAVTVYGGFDCSTWAYSAESLHTVVAPASGAALAIQGATQSLAFQNVEFDAAAASTPGASSIAAVVNGASSVTFVNCKFVAGAGSNGASASTPTTPLPTPTKGNDADANSNDGGAPLTCMCPSGVSSTGGRGGGGTPITGTPTDGQNGQPAIDANKGNAAPSPAGVCTIGAVGATGAAVSNAPSPTTHGSINAGVWTATAGGAGSFGTTGQGGGGGGGGYAAALPNGNGGGGGGCGGCGGAGGPGGGGGGSSIGVLVFQSSVTFQGAQITTANAGAGGHGAAGQAGALGAGHGNSPNNGCQGGSGGMGGAGGAGAGGAGGLSVGIAYQGTAPTVDSNTQSAIATGAAGAKGIGGAPGVNDGPAGVSVPQLSL